MYVPQRWTLTHPLHVSYAFWWLDKSLRLRKWNEVMVISIFGTVYRASHMLHAIYVQTFWTGASDYSCKLSARGLVYANKAARDAMAYFSEYDSIC